MKTLKEIEALTKNYADGRELLAATVQALKEEHDRTTANYRRTLLSQVAKAKERKAELAAAIEESAEQFKKPRTVTFHGVTVGFGKGKGKIVFADADKVVELIEKHLADKADVLIKTEKTPIKKAIGNLGVDELKKIGCKVTGTDDQVVIKDAAAEIDKLVAAFLGEEEPQE